MFCFHGTDPDVNFGIGIHFKDSDTSEMNVMFPLIKSFLLLIGNEKSALGRYILKCEMVVIRRNSYKRLSKEVRSFHVKKECV